MAINTTVNTLVVRSVMRAHGHSLIYTNKLKNGNQTVKCYLAPGDSSGAVLRRAIKAELEKYGHKIIGIRVLTTDAQFNRRYASFIVELPRYLATDDQLSLDAV